MYLNKRYNNGTVSYTTYFLWVPTILKNKITLIIAITKITKKTNPVE